MSIKWLVLCSALAACGSSSNPAKTAPVLTSSTAEPAGANCQYGGTRIDIGYDSNHNGILDPSEIDSTFYECNSAPPPDPLANVHKGDLVLLTQDDVTAAQQWTGVIGSVYFNEDNVPAFDAALPNLVWITGELGDCAGGGGLSVFSKRLEPGESPPPPPHGTLSMPALVEVGGDMSFECSNLGALTFTALTNVGSSIFIDIRTLASFSTPALTTIGSDIDIENTQVASLSFGPPGDQSPNLYSYYNYNLSDCAMYDLIHSWRVAGWHGSWNLFDTACTDYTHICQSLPVGADTTDWGECYQASDFATARTACQAIGAGWDLAYFTADSETADVAAAMIDTSYWIGYWQVDAGDPYTWVQAPVTDTYAPQCSVLDADNGTCATDNTQPQCNPGCTVADPTFWNPVEPTHDAQPDCVQIFENNDNGTLTFAANDATCDQIYYPLCRYVAP